LFKNPPEMSAEDLEFLVISTTTELIPVTAAATTAARPREVVPGGTSFINSQGTAFQGLSIQPSDSALHVFAFSEFDETEPSRGPGHLVANYQG